MSNYFNSEGFYAALDAHRRSKDVTWKKVALKSGVSASTLTRMGQGKRPDVDSLAALAAWSGIDVSKFYRTNSIASGAAGTMSDISALLRADPNLQGDAAQMIEKTISSLYEGMRKRSEKE